jgi:hypothetical protein
MWVLERHTARRARCKDAPSMSRMSQKRRCWTAAAICAILASGVRVPALLGPGLSRPRDPFADATAMPALHANFAAATEVSTRSNEEERQDGPDDPASAAGPRPFTADAIYAAIKGDPLAVRAHGGVLSNAGEFRSVGDPNAKAAGGERALEGSPRGAANPEIDAGAGWGSGSIGPLAADTTSGDSSDARRVVGGGRHSGDHDGTGAFVPGGPLPITVPVGSDGFPIPVGLPSGGVGFPGPLGAPPSPAIRAVPLPAPLGLGLYGLVLVAASVQKRLGLRK